MAGARTTAPAGTRRIKKTLFGATNSGPGSATSFINYLVQIDLDTLPDDTAILQQMLREVVTVTTQQHAELHAENDKLRLLIQRLLRHQFGRPAPVRAGGPRTDRRREPGGSGRGGPGE